MMIVWKLFFLSVLQLLILTASANVVVVTISNRTECTFSAYGASFGPQLEPDAKIRGFMQIAEPPDACKPIKRPPKQTEAPLQLPYFALIARSPGNCNFDVKVFHAQQAGFAAAVVHNIPGHDEIFVMHANSLVDVDSWPFYAGHLTLKNGKRPTETDQLPRWSPVDIVDRWPFYAGHLTLKNGLSAVKDYNITIPSQFIGFQDSLTLTSFIEADFMYSVVLNGQEPSFPEPYFYIIPFFVVVCIIVVILLTALIVKVCREYFHTRRARLSKRHLKKLPTKKFVKNSDPYETCAICLDDFEEGDKIRILPCNHAYHCVCIDPWLLKQKRCCPVCKRKIRFGRRRRDPPTAGPDSSDSEGAADTGDERTPLLGAAGGPESLNHSASIGVINGGYDEEDGSAARGVVGPAGYGSFDPVASSQAADSVSSSHVVEVHAPRDQGTEGGSAQAPAVV